MSTSKHTTGFQRRSCRGFFSAGGGTTNQKVQTATARRGQDQLDLSPTGLALSVQIHFKTRILLNYSSFFLTKSTKSCWSKMHFCCIWAKHHFQHTDLSQSTAVFHNLMSKVWRAAAELFMIQLQACSSQHDTAGSETISSLLELIHSYRSFRTSVSQTHSPTLFFHFVCSLLSFIWHVGPFLLYAIHFNYIVFQTESLIKYKRYIVF